jgi:hypothetical protein
MDKSVHPIPVLAGGPGVGKSRFLDEIERLLNEKAEVSDDPAIQDVFKDIAVVNITYGNGSAASPRDKDIGGVASVAIRVIFEYFRPERSDGTGEFDFRSFFTLCNTMNVSTLDLTTALQVVYMDIMEKRKSTRLHTQVLVLGIDELNKLYDESDKISKDLVRALGTIMCSPPSKVFFVPILAGTIEGPLENYVTGSMHRPLRLPLFLLKEEHVLAIGKGINLDGQYMLTNPLFRRAIADIDGHVKALEYFYNFFVTEMKAKGNHASSIQIKNIISRVQSAVAAHYDLPRFSNWLTPALTRAILGISVKDNDEIMTFQGSTTYRELSSRGILNLRIHDRKTGMHRILFPYLWVVLLVLSSNDKGLTHWKSMINYDEKMYWQQWEEFNLDFWALRLSLFRLLGKSKVLLKDLLRGALLSRRFPEVEVAIPEDFKIYRLRKRYPLNGRQPGFPLHEIYCFQVAICFSRL